jgi:hypothetical protein
MHPRPGRTAQTELASFLMTLDEAGLGKGDLRPVLDIEETALTLSQTAGYARAAVKALRKDGHEHAGLHIPGVHVVAGGLSACRLVDRCLRRGQAGDPEAVDSCRVLAVHEQRSCSGHQRRV